MSDSSRPHGLQPTRFLHPWDFPGKSTEVGAIAFSDDEIQVVNNKIAKIYITYFCSTNLHGVSTICYSYLMAGFI